MVEQATMARVADAISPCRHHYAFATDEQINEQTKKRTKERTNIAIA